LLDAPIDAHFAAFTAGEANVSLSGASEEGEDVEEMAEFVRGRPVGHIHKRAYFWVEHLHPDPYVHGILDHGFKVPVDWDKIPESYEEADNNSARKYYNFVQEEVARLVNSGQVVECDAKPRCCNPLTVEDDRYHMTSLQDAINSTRKGNFQVVFDLKLAFHHVRLHVESYKLMGFKVVD
jgi:hypothetical protein